MKDLNLIVWLTQLGLSTAFPLIGFVLLSLWLRSTFHFGNWVLWIGIALGVISAIDGFRTSLKAMSRLAKRKSQEDDSPISFNNHD